MSILRNLSSAALALRSSILGVLASLKGRNTPKMPVICTCSGFNTMNPSRRALRNASRLLVLKVLSAVQIASSSRTEILTGSPPISKLANGRFIPIGPVTRNPPIFSAPMPTHARSFTISLTLLPDLFAYSSMSDFNSPSIGISVGFICCDIESNDDKVYLLL